MPFSLTEVVRSCYALLLLWFILQLDTFPRSRRFIYTSKDRRTCIPTRSGRTVIRFTLDLPIVLRQAQGERISVRRWVYEVGLSFD
ncbi:MAG: hypothetical protein H6749_07465 [Nitrospiraceae bacterium]|nr:hypothetical protein [Nitrospiraceae bacterium]